MENIEISLRKIQTSFKASLTGDDLFSQVASDLRCIAMKVNVEFTAWHLFYEYDSYKIFTIWFKRLFETIQKDVFSLDGTIFEILRDLLEIIFKIASRRIKLCDLFCDAGLFDHILSFYSNDSLMRLICDHRTAILIKVMRIFYFLSRSICFSSRILAIQHLDKLKITMNLIRKLLSENGGENERNEFDALRRMFFVCVSFLREKFSEPVENLPPIKDSMYFVSNGLIQHFFTKTSNDFLHLCKRVDREFINEMNEIDHGTVHSLITLANQNTPMNAIPSFIIPDLILNAIVMWSTSKQCDDLKSMGFHNCKHFYRSVLFYGYVVEKLLVLKILQNFCDMDSLRSEIFSDLELVEYLKKLLDESIQEDSDNMNIRLRNGINSLFDLMPCYIP